jgi:hypothetical protein
VLHGYEKIAAQLSTDPAFANQVAEIKEKLDFQKARRKPREAV